jgi:transposase
MPAKRISMRKIRDVLRLKGQAGLSIRQIARCVSISHSTVRDYLQRAERAGLTWPLPEGLDEAALDRMLFPPAAPSHHPRPQPDWQWVHREMRRKGVTLMLLWQEYKAAHPDGYQYSRFCDHYRAWRGKLDLVMRQEHRAGEKLFVDYAGQTAEVVDAETGELRQAQIFVAVLGASNYTYAEATWTQSLPDWIGAHQRAFDFFGGVPEIVVPDNLKAGVTRAHRYEPDLNPTYQDLASHYGVAVIPARVRRPRDKAKAEAGVLLVERWILAALRNQTFFCLDELNEAISELLGRLNERPFKKLEGCRRVLFELLDRPALRPLPAEPYVYAEWKKARVHIDYHVEIEGHYYSVPYQHVRQQVDVRITVRTVECFFKERRIASHLRSWRTGHHTTVKEHMPPAHRYLADWTPERMTRWAAKTGEATALLIARVMASRRHPQQGYRTCLGILRLAETHGEERLEAAARRALAIGAKTYKSVVSILQNGLESRPLPGVEETDPVITHDNIRGADYYATHPARSAHHRIDQTRSYEC